MTAIADLPRDQRAVLSLLLGKGRSYAEIAGMLQIDAGAVRERAHAALRELVPPDATAPPPQRRSEVSDYLLSQQTAPQRSETLDYLDGSAVGRAWARSLAAELRTVATAELPQIPIDSAVATPPPTSAGAAARQSKPALGRQHGHSTGGAVSRRGGAILLASVAAIVALVLLLTSGGGAGSHKKAAAAKRTATPPTPATNVVGQVNLTSPHKGGRAAGVATLLQQGTTKGIALQVTGLPATTGTKYAYAVWLYNSRSSSQRIGFAPPVKSDGKLGAVAPTPANLGSYRALLLTLEKNARATGPGTVILSGPLPKQR